MGFYLLKSLTLNLNIIFPNGLIRALVFLHRPVCSQCCKKVSNETFVLSLSKKLQPL